MAYSQGISIKGINNVLKRLKEVDKKIKTDLLAEYERTSKEIRMEAQNILTRNNHVVTGNLRGSLKEKVKINRKNGSISRINASVGTNIHYAFYVERYDSYLFLALETIRPKFYARVKNIVGKM